jgi:predicted esterase
MNKLIIIIIFIFIIKNIYNKEGFTNEKCNYKNHCFNSKCRYNKDQGYWCYLKPNSYQICKSEGETIKNLKNMVLINWSKEPCKKFNKKNNIDKKINILQKGCPDNFPYRTIIKDHELVKLKTVKEKVKYPYCYKTKECSEGKKNCSKKMWTYHPEIKKTNNKVDNSDHIIKNIENNNFDYLLKNDLFFDINNVNLDKIKNKLYDKFKKEFNKVNKQDNLILLNNNYDFKIRYTKLKNYSNKFVQQKYGYSINKSTNPNEKLPIYICLHGGGAGSGNDKYWNHMKIMYRYAFSQGPGILIWLRGIIDAANTHYAQDSYSLLDKLIVRFSSIFNVDLNKIYLLGFSAGGDGVYTLSARNLDIFSAVSMSAGHSNNISLRNLKNLPILLQMGILDNGYNRLFDVLKKYKELKDNKYITELIINIHDVKSTNKNSNIYYQGNNKKYYILQSKVYNKNNLKVNKLLTHSFIPAGINFKKERLVYAINNINKFNTDFKNMNESFKNSGKIIYNKYKIRQYSEKNRRFILNNYWQSLAYRNKTHNINSGNYIKQELEKIIKDNMIVKNSNEILWLRKYTRDPVPNHIILNGNFYGFRQWTPGLELTSQKMIKRFNLQYWLDFSISNLPNSYKWNRTSSSGGLTNYDIEAKIISNNKINIKLPNDIKKVRVLLNDKKLDLSKKIFINKNEYKPKANLKIMVRTLLERGDINYIFIDQYDYIKN